MRRSCSMTITASACEARRGSASTARVARSERYGGSTNTSRHGRRPARAARRARPHRRRAPSRGPRGRARAGCRGSPSSAGLPASTNVAWAAPRDSASMPSAPEPANRSRTCMPVDIGPRMLKIASRTFSEVGRVAAPCGGAQDPAAEAAADDAHRRQQCYGLLLWSRRQSLPIRLPRMSLAGNLAAWLLEGALANGAGPRVRAARGRSGVDVRRAGDARSASCRRRCAACGSQRGERVLDPDARHARGGGGDPRRDPRRRGRGAGRPSCRRPTTSRTTCSTPAR